MKEFPKINSKDADLIAARIRTMLGPYLTDMLDRYDVNANHILRYLYISDLCRRTRETKGLTIKQISSKLKIPQYRLKAAENGNARGFDPGHLEKYIDFLGLRKEFDDWLKENKDVYDGIVNRNAK